MATNSFDPSKPTASCPNARKWAEIPTWSTTQIKDGVGRITLNRVQERCVVLADIVIPCAIPERVGQPIVLGDGTRGTTTPLPAANTS